MLKVYLLSILLFGGYNSNLYAANEEGEPPLVREIETSIGDISLEEGTYQISLSVYVNEGLQLSKFYTRIDEGWQVQEWDLSVAKQGEWVSLSNELLIDEAVVDSKFFIQVPNYQSIAGTNGSFYIDNITIRKADVSAHNPVHVFECEVYPNPVKDVLNMNLPVNSRVNIYNTMGTCVLMIPSSTQKQIKLPIQFLENGIYLVQITNQNKVLTKKIMVNK